MGSLTAYSTPYIFISSILLNWLKLLFPSHVNTNTIRRVTISVLKITVSITLKSTSNAFSIVFVTINAMDIYVSQIGSVSYNAIE